MRQRMRSVLKRSPEFLAGLLCAAALLIVTLGGVGLLSAQVFLGPKRDYVAIVTSSSGQRDVSIDMTTTPPRFEVGRSVVNGLQFSGGATGVTPVITAAVSGADAGAGLTINPGTSGLVGIGGTHTSGIAVFPAITHCAGLTVSTPLLSPTPDRVAANDWSLARLAAGAETINWTCDLNINLTRSTLSKGIRIDALNIAYDIGVANLTSASTPTLRRTTYANATANAIDGTGLTLSGTHSTTSPTAATQRGYLTGFTISSTAFQTTSNTSLNLEWQTVLQNTGLYRLYAITVTYSSALY